MSNKSKQAGKNSSLNERAMLANLSLSIWEGRRKDKRVTDEVVSDAKAEKDAGTWWTRIIPPSALKAIGTAVDRARASHYRLTLPWNDAGSRILSSMMFADYSAKMREHRAEFEAAVDEFLNAYPRLVKEAKTRLGDLFIPEQFPYVDQLRDKFAYRIAINPLPSGGDFRVDLGDDLTSEIRADIEKQAASAMEVAMADVWQRLHAAVSKIADKLGDSKAIFRDSLIENVAELCDVLPKLNVTGDRELDRMRNEVAAKLSTQEPEVLRKNPTARADAAKQAGNILKQMETFMGKPKT